MLSTGELPHSAAAGGAPPVGVLAILQRLCGGDPGSHQLAIEQLYSVPPAAAEAFLLQVLHSAVAHRCAAQERCQQALRSFVLRLVSRSLMLGLRARWIVDAGAPALQRQGAGSSVAGLAESIEEACVGRVSVSVASAAPAQSGSESARAEADPGSTGLTAPEAAAVRKEARRVVFGDVREFLADMVALSGRLREIDRPDRKKALRAELARVSDTLPRRRVMMPVVGARSAAETARWVVRLVPAECTVFSSRERTPFLLVAEVVPDPAGRPAADPVGGSGEVALFDPQTEEAADAAAAAAPCAQGAEAPASSDEVLVPTMEGAGLIRHVFGPPWVERRRVLQAQSPYGRYPGWTTAAVVVKEGDDLRQEELALQLITLLQRIWTDAGIPVILHPYAAVSTTADGGYLEFIEDSASLDGLKKAANVSSLLAFFLRAYGPAHSESFREAQQNFCESMAGYAVVSYLLNIKDRHNGNLMISRDGRLIHIDFGFMFVTAPGGVVNCEWAPFKLTPELLEVMGGTGGTSFGHFKLLVYQCLSAAKARAAEILAAVELMLPLATLPCFGGPAAAGQVLQQLRRRLCVDSPGGPVEEAREASRLIQASTGNLMTRGYDRFQYWQNGIQ